jgi:hypothetical protein
VVTDCILDGRLESFAAGKFYGRLLGIFMRERCKRVSGRSDNAVMSVLGVTENRLLRR